MNSRLYIPAALLRKRDPLRLRRIQVSANEAYLPTGLQRALDITLQDGKPYVFSFIITPLEAPPPFTPEQPGRLNGILHVVNFGLPPTLRNRWLLLVVQ